MDYLIKGVQSEEYASLKSLEREIVASVMNGFNDVWKPRVQDINATFLYNPERNYIGIFIDRDTDIVLAGGIVSINEEEDAVAGSLYDKLEERLTQLRLLNERWV